MILQTNDREMAIKVATDVIDSISILRNVSRATGYVTSDETTYGIIRLLATKETSNEQAQLLKKTCTVCALGACFLSLVSIDNKFTFPTQGSDTWMYFGNGFLSKSMERLMDVFTPEQMALMENAFECSYASYAQSNGYSYSFSPDHQEKRNRAIEFGGNFTYLKYGDDVGRLRLRAIMENVIQNNGEFIP